MALLAFRYLLPLFGDVPAPSSEFFQPSAYCALFQITKPLSKENERAGKREREKCRGRWPGFSTTNGYTLIFI